MENLKAHIKKHKLVYSHAATGLVLAGITWVIMKERHAVLPKCADGLDTATMRSFSFNFWASNSGNITSVISREGRGHPGYITRWLEGMIDYETQGLAASEHGVTPGAMSAHIRGVLPDINGKHFVRVPTN